MVSINEELMIDMILSQENADDIVKEMFYKYAGLSVENARKLLSMISTISDKALARVEQESLANREAAFWLMVQRCISQEDEKTFFASMVPVCQAMFPSGKCDNNRGEAEQNYWALFLKQFKNKKVFSLERDRAWADTYGYTQYLQLVETNLEVV